MAEKVFTVPCNSVGKAFVTELAVELDNFVDSGGKDESALFNFATLPTLLLQKPTRENCSYKVATDHLDLWRDRKLESFLDDGRCLQMHVHGGHTPGGRLKGQKDHAREFGLSMASGQVHQALRTLAEQTTPELASGVLQAGETITLADGRFATMKDLLTEKHPQAQRASSNILIWRSHEPQSDQIRSFDTEANRACGFTVQGVSRAFRIKCRCLASSLCVSERPVNKDVPVSGKPGKITRHRGG